MWTHRFIVSRKTRSGHLERGIAWIHTSNVFDLFLCVTLSRSTYQMSENWVWIFFRVSRSHMKNAAVDCPSQTGGGGWRQGKAPAGSPQASGDFSCCILTLAHLVFRGLTGTISGATLADHCVPRIQALWKNSGKCPDLSGCLEAALVIKSHEKQTH